ILAGEMNGPMQRHDGLARARGAGHARRSGVISFHPLPLLRVKEDGPFLPRKIEGPLQLFDIAHDTEASLRIGMIEWIRLLTRRLRKPRFTAVASSSRASAASL